MKKRVLFLCTSNRCRSQLAEAMINNDLGDRFDAFSAGTTPTTPHPLLDQVLREIGIDHSSARSKHLDEFADQTFDYVITLCDNADKACPMFMGGVKRVHIGFPNPDKKDGALEERLEVLRSVRDQIHERVQKYLLNTDEQKKLDQKTESIS